MSVAWIQNVEIAVSRRLPDVAVEIEEGTSKLGVWHACLCLDRSPTHLESMNLPMFVLAQSYTLRTSTFGNEVR